MKHALLAAAAPIALAAASSARQLEVIFCEHPASPKSTVPGALDETTGLPDATTFKSIDDLFLSPDGSRWMIRGRTQQGSSEENIMLLGSGVSGTMFAQEGQPVHAGVPGEIYDFFGSGVGRFNSLNQFAYSARARGGLASVFQKVIFWDGASFSIPTQMGDLYTGLIDVAPNPVGDETVGNSIGSIHVLDNGTIGAQDSTILNIHTSKRPAIFYDRAMFHQVENTTFLDYAGTTSVQVDNLSANTFYTSPDGAHWIVEVDLDMSATVSRFATAYDGRVRLEPGQVVPGSSVVVGDVFASSIAANGDWFARGRDNSGTTTAAPDWAARNATLIAKTGDSIEGGAETYGDTFYAFTGNAAGDWVLVANTSEPNTLINEVVVVNGTIVAREGDPVDLDGNGSFDDDAFIGRSTGSSVFQANDFALSDDLVLFFIATLKNGAGADLGSSPAFGGPDVLLRLDLGPSCAIVDTCDPALPDVTDGCMPDASWTGTPDVAQCSTVGPSDFVVTFSSMSDNKNCNVVIGKGAPIAGSWSLESARCFPTPYTRTGFQDTGDVNGGAACGGEVALDVEDYLQGGNPLLTPVIAGDEFVVQAWYRDPNSAKTTQMSDAVHFTVCP